MYNSVEVFPDAVPFLPRHKQVPLGCVQSSLLVTLGDYGLSLSLSAGGLWPGVLQHGDW